MLEKFWPITPHAPYGPMVMSCSRDGPCYISLEMRTDHSSLQVLNHALHILEVDAQQVLLIVADVALPFLYGLVVAHPNLVRYLVNQAEVVADQHQPAVEALDGLRQRVDGLHVQMVCWLIQQQHIGILHANHGKHNAALLSLAEVANLGRLHLASDAIAADKPAPLLNVTREGVIVGVHVLEELQRRHLLLQDIHRVLMIFANHQVAVARDDALGGGQLAGHELQQRGLASAVWPHQRDARVGIDAEIQVRIKVVLFLAAV
mmetsp:Transcript_32749/g.83666  ORF Transcript_32749/g.83666 Transcript_32749/m.83666 type:complete len:262 (-) Transcript_32749:1342-2127(-)